MGRSYRLPRSPAAQRRRRPWLLYLSVLLVAAVAAVAFVSVRREWLRRIGQSRGQTIFELVEDTVPNRPTETPGVTAWLHLELKRYRQTIADPATARLYGEIADWHDDASLPPFLAGLREVLLLPPPHPAAGDVPRPLPAAALGGLAGEDDPRTRLRVQRWVELHGRWFALTRRRTLDREDLRDLQAPSNRFLLLATHHLLAVGDALQAELGRHPLPPVPGRRPPRLVRVYAVSEDGTLVSAPLAPDPANPANPATAANPAGTADAASRKAAALGEGREFRKLPELPNFVPNEFVFRFDPEAPQPRAYWSGLYLDLGGQGVVATLLAPFRDAETGYRGVIAADLTFDFDWQAFAAHIEPPMSAAVVQLRAPAREPWRPWAAMAAQGPATAPGELRAAVAALAAAEAKTGRPVNPFYLYHATVEGRGAVAALQVAATTWLVTLFPATRSSFALLPAALLGLLVVLLLGAFEASRRRTERAQLAAERALAEKQNLLNTMQVPLMVVDPNTDEVIYGNQAAESLGITAGTRAGDMVVDEPRAREHYARMQTADTGLVNARRAYGVPLRLRGESGELETRHAIVRSVAVTAPIAALRADQRHRLGVLFLLEPATDLALWSGELVAATRADERRRLAGLLAHGVDTLARVLAHCLESEGLAAAAQAELNRWLAGYLERRVLATAWLLEHWDAEPPLPPDCSIEAAQARATIDGWRTVFARVRADPRLRSRLHWDNGTLAEPPPATLAVLDARIDWPDAYWFASPVRGGFGFFLGEVLINAVRHGRPGTVPSVAITLDPVRRELLFAVENELPDGAAQAAERAAESYGGRRLLERLAHLCDWQELRFERLEPRLDSRLDSRSDRPFDPPFDRRSARFEVRWRVPVSERGDPSAAD
ncbi:MAG TPA: hypothetical protein VOA80_19780 [Thermoanaerobaculia bacterium]|nr:hypothetical protein [Thermoanaerobaculia bacterium]